MHYWGDSMKKILLCILSVLCFFSIAFSVTDVKASGWLEKGVELVVKGKYNEAIHAFNQAIQIDPTDAVAYNNRGAAYGQMGNHTQQIEDCNKALQFNPKDAVAYNNRGVAYGELGNYEQEIEDCTKAIQLNPTLAVAYYHRGIAYQKLGNRKQAEKDKRMAYSLNPKRTWDKVEIVATEKVTRKANEKPLTGMGKKEQNHQNPTQKNEKPVKVVGNSDSKRYHLPGMMFYDKVKEHHRVTFNSEEEAIKAGYHKASR
jgi:tetratricopeptide (TPR) repeat protein